MFKEETKQPQKPVSRFMRGVAKQRGVGVGGVGRTGCQKGRIPPLYASTVSICLTVCCSVCVCMCTLGSS